MSELVFITGGAGYLGSVMVPALLDAGYRVRVLDNFRHRQPRLLAHCGNPNLDVIRGDCRDEQLLKKAISDAQIIIPLAAIVGAPACDMDPVAAKTVNFGAVQSLLK